MNIVKLLNWFFSLKPAPRLIVPLMWNGNIIFNVQDIFQYENIKKHFIVQRKFKDIHFIIPYSNLFIFYILRGKSQ